MTGPDDAFLAPDDALLDLPEDLDTGTADPTGAAPPSAEEDAVDDPGSGTGSDGAGARSE